MCAILTVIKGIGEFVESPLNVAVTATVSNNITLKCAVRRNNSKPLWDNSNHNNTNMLWYIVKNAKLLVTSGYVAVAHFPRHSVLGYPHSFDLFISSVQPEDAGQYICSDLETTKTASAVLIVLG